MFCRLTLFNVLISLAGSAALAQSDALHQATNTRNPRGAVRYSIDWDQLPLGDAIVRLQHVSNAELFLDRRVDPSQPVKLSLTDASVDEIIAGLAAACAIGDCRLDRLYFLAPTPVASRVVALAAERRREVAALPVESRRSLLERRRIVWPRLTEPRGLVTRLAADHGWRVVGGERIPYDLWAAGSLPAMSLADQLTVLLAGFDRTYRTLPERRTIEIVPVNWSTIAAAPAPPHLPPRRDGPTPSASQIFTLRVENQPVGKVLEQLGRRLGWKLAVDEAGIRAAGRSLDTRVSFSVENADEDRLLDALLAPAGLQAQRDGKNVRVTPR